MVIFFRGVAMVQILIDYMHSTQPQEVILAAVQTARAVLKDMSAPELQIFSSVLLRIDGAAKSLLALDPGALGGGGWFGGAGGGGEVHKLSRQLRSLELKGPASTEPAGRVPDIENEEDEDEEEEDEEGHKEPVSLLTSVWIECYDLLAEFYAKVSNTCRMHGHASLTTCSTVPFDKCPSALI
jgi:hypothetical protein